MQYRYSRQTGDSPDPIAYTIYKDKPYNNHGTWAIDYGLFLPSRLPVFPDPACRQAGFGLPKLFPADLQSVRTTHAIFLTNHLQNQKLCLPLQPANEERVLVKRKRETNFRK